MTALPEDTVYEATCSRGPITVTVSVRLEPGAYYEDQQEQGESVGVVAARLLHQAIRASEPRVVPF